MSGLLILLGMFLNSGVAVLITAFLLSLVIAYLVGKFSPNLWVVGIIILLIQFGGYAWGLRAGHFFGQSILEIVFVLVVTFIWYMAAAQFYLWIHARSIEPSGGK